MIKIIKHALFMILIMPLCGQNTKVAPDCTLSFSGLSASGNSVVYNNLPQNNVGSPCTTWVLAYTASTGSPTISVSIQGAPNNNGAAGSFSTISGATASTSPSGTILLKNSAGNGYYPFMRVAVTTLSSGTLSGTLNGWRDDAGSVNGGGGSSGCPNPCPVNEYQPANSTASWTSSTTMNTALSVSIAGYANIAVTYVQSGTITGGTIAFEISPDNTNWQSIGLAPLTVNTSLVSGYALASGTNGWQMFVGGFFYFRVRLSSTIMGAGTALLFIAPSSFGTEFAQVVGQSNPSLLNGTMLIQGTNGSPSTIVAGTSQASVSLSSATDVVMVSGVNLKTTYITKFDLSWDNSAAVTLREGTTSSTPCDTSTTALSGAYNNLVALFEDYGTNFSTLHSTSTDLDICLHFSTSVTGGGQVFYAQF